MTAGKSLRVRPNSSDFHVTFRGRVSSNCAEQKRPP
jgi:hypothetical protein